MLLFCPGFPVLHTAHLELQLVFCDKQAGRGILRAPEYREALSFPEFPGNPGCLVLKDPKVLKEALPVPEFGTNLGVGKRVWRSRLWEPERVS